MKRKRVLYYDDTEKASKKVKLLSDDDRDTFLKEKTYQTFNPKKFSFEEQKFGDISEEDDHIILFRENKMKNNEEKIQFQQYFWNNQDEYNDLVRPPPSTSSPPKPKHTIFSKYYGYDSVELVREFFGKEMKTCKWDILDTFTPGTDKELDTLAKEVFNLWNDARIAFGREHNDGNEAYRRFFVNDMLKVVLKNLQTGTDASQYEMLNFKPEEENMYNAEDVKGRVDYVHICGDQIMLVIEAKEGDVSKGVSQLIMEMRSSYQKNSIELDYVYGFVTNAVEWRPVRMKYSKDEKTIGFAASCTIDANYSNEKVMTQAMEKVIYVMREMFKRGVQDYNFKK